MPVNQVSFSQPGAYQAEAEDIERRRRLAEAMQAQSMQDQPSGQMVSGWYVPQSWTQGLAHALKGVAADYEMEKLTKRQNDLGQKYQKDLADTLRRAGQAQTGTPGSSQTIMDETANGGEGALAQINAPAVAADPTKAASIYMEHPATQQMGLGMMQRNAEMQALEQALRGGQGAPGSTGTGGVSGAMPPLSLLAAGPAGVKVWEALKEQNKPIPLREGDLVVPDGQGGFKSAYTQPKLEAGMQPVRGPDGRVTGAEAIPGYAQGRAGVAGAVAGAQEGARAGMDIVTVPDGRGGSVQMTREQAAKLLGPQGGQQPGPQPGPPPTPQTGGKMGPAMDSLMQEVQSQLEAASKAPDEGSRAMALRLANEAAAQLKKLGVGVNVPELSGRGLGTTGPKEEDAYKEARAKGFVKQAEDLRGLWQKSNNSIQNLDRLEGLLTDPNVGKGALAETISGLKNVAATFGVDIKGLPAEQAIVALTNEMALQARNPAGGAGMPGAMSDSDRAFLANMQPGLSKTPEGRKQIIQTMRRIAERERDIAKMANAYERKNGRLDANFERELYDYAEKNPLFSPTTANAGLSSAEQQELDALRARLKK